MRSYYSILFSALFSLPFITGPILAASDSDSDYFANLGDPDCTTHANMERPSSSGVWSSAFFGASSASTATVSPGRRTGDRLLQPVAEGASKPISFGPDDDAIDADIARGCLLDSEEEKHRVKQVLAILIEMYATSLHNPENQPFLLQTLKDLMVYFNFDANMLEKPWIMKHETISSHIPESSMKLGEKEYKNYEHYVDRHCNSMQPLDYYLDGFATLDRHFYVAVSLLHITILFELHNVVEYFLSLGCKLDDTKTAYISRDAARRFLLSDEKMQESYSAKQLADYLPKMVW